MELQRLDVVHPIADVQTNYAVLRHVLYVIQHRRARVFLIGLDCWQLFHDDIVAHGTQTERIQQFGVQRKVVGKSVTVVDTEQQPLLEKHVLHAVVDYVVGNCRHLMRKCLELRTGNELVYAFKHLLCRGRTSFAPSFGCAVIGYLLLGASFDVGFLVVVAQDTSEFAQNVHACAHVAVRWFGVFHFGDFHRAVTLGKVLVLSLHKGNHNVVQVRLHRVVV